MQGALRDVKILPGLLSLQEIKGMRQVKIINIYLGCKAA
jgi:hypothetical protein